MSSDHGGPGGSGETGSPGGPRGSSDTDGPVPDADATLSFPEANVAAVRAVANVLEGTFGPRACDVLLVGGEEHRDDAATGVAAGGDVIVTADGATILATLPIAHPLAPAIRRVLGPARPGETDIEGEHVPDGITTRILLADALLSEGAALLDQGVHPATLRDGYQRCATVATDRLVAGRLAPTDSGWSRTVRAAAARTAMTGDVPGGLADELASIAVDAADAVGLPDETSLVVRTTRRGSLADTQLVRGAVLNRAECAHDAMPAEVSDAVVLLVDGADRGGLQDREVSGPSPTAAVDSPADVAAFVEGRRDRKRRLVDRFAAAGVDVVVTRLGIDETYQRLLADEGILGVRAVSSLDLRRLAAATGASPVFDPTDVESDDLGRAGRVVERETERYGDRRKRQRMVLFEDCIEPSSVAVAVHGAFGQLGHRATTAVRNGSLAAALAAGAGGALDGVVPGGGAAHVDVARAVRDAGRRWDSREQLAAEAYADAVESVVATLARNAGLDPIAAVADVRAAHATGDRDVGIVFPGGAIGDCRDAGIVDPVATVRDAYRFGTDLATLVLGIDDTIDAVDRSDGRDPGDVHFD